MIFVLGKVGAAVVVGAIVLVVFNKLVVSGCVMLLLISVRDSVGGFSAASLAFVSCKDSLVIAFGATDEDEVRFLL